MTRGVKRYSLIPAFLPGTAGNLFSLYYQPDESLSKKHIIVFFPPFADEFNKSRRMISLQAQQLASMGFGVLIVDLYGTGDSEGDFADARMEIWRSDMNYILQWLNKRNVNAITLWGMRLGALLAVDSIPIFSNYPTRLLLWAPVIKAEQFITQFLRLRLAADMMKSGVSNETTKSMREQLAKGNGLEVAGYQLDAQLVTALDSLDLNKYSLSHNIPTDWFELVAGEDRPPPLPTQKITEKWSAAGVPLRLYTIPGSTFWNTPEITLVPELLTKTTNALAESVCKE